jgi:Putative restriction endonuclease
MTTSPLVQNSKPNETATTTSKKRNPTIEDFQFRDGLPTAAELPCSDGAAVDKDWSRRFPPAKKVRSELQELIPGLLKTILLDIWRDRTNWLFSINMAFHYHPGKPHIAPDGLLSLGVAQAADENMRSSFVLWEENVLPLFALEIVSKTLGSENTTKFDIYQETGILYYLIYAPLRKRKAKFQLYKLIDGKYVLQSNGQQPYWMPEIGLAIGAEKQLFSSSQREWLYWYDESNTRHLTPTERADSEALRAKAEALRVKAEVERANNEALRSKAAEERAELSIAAQQAAEQQNNALRQRLIDLGIDPDSMPLS